jgi:hypothetical protein
MKNQVTYKTKQLDGLQKFIQEKMGTAHEKSAKRYNLRAKERNYKTGNKVWRTNFRLPDATKQYAAKLGDRHIKCRIVDRIGVNTYRLQDVEKGTNLGIFSLKDFFA